jgi:hypothetical protein
MSLGFIFMAIHRDRTTPNARALIDEALSLGVRNIGFKDIGLPLGDLRELAKAIRAGGARVFFELVSLDPESEIRSARAAADFGVDWLLGGVSASEVAPIAKENGIAYAPRVDEIVASAEALCALEGVRALDLLAYRHGEPIALTQAVVNAVDLPVIVAGSIDSPERISAVIASGAAGFTVGSSAISGEFPAQAPDFAAQIRAIQQAAASAAGSHQLNLL